MKIGIYGGTFDPIHHGHLILARAALEEFGWDRILFVPAAISPHKLHCVPTTPQLRCAMLAAAIAGEPQFACNECEIGRSGPSFTIDTVEFLRTQHAGAEFFYLIGEDNVRLLPTWHRYEELARIVQFVVLDRTGLNSEHSFPTLRRHVDISATEIRNRVASGQSIRYLVPEPVAEIIRRHQLYLEPPHHL